MNCINCPHHCIVADPDPSDWFNDDDEAIVCSLTPNPKKNTASKYRADHSEYRSVAASLRPYETAKIAAPKWCPLKKD
jgi:hypothetical protein